MLASTAILRCGKIEQGGTTNNDALGEDLAHGLLAVAVGAGVMSFSQLWAQSLVTHFLTIPLMSKDPFETDWWMRQAQEKYKQAPNPAGRTAPETQKQDAQATLATLRITQVDKASARARLLVFGESCIIQGKAASQQVISFAMDTPTSFDQKTIRVPAKSILFDRELHCGQIKDIDLSPNDTLVLATPAVSKWIVTNGGGRYPSPWQAFLEVTRQTPESWAGFVAACRTQKTMTEEDCTALILQLSTDKGTQLGSTVDHTRAVCEQRKKEYEHAKREQNNDLLAVAIGDGVDLRYIGVQLLPTVIEYARSVATALNRMNRVVREASYGPRSEITQKVEPMWATYASLLSNESCAKGLRDALKMYNVPLKVEQSPTSPAPMKPPVNAPISAQQAIGQPASPVPSKPPVSTPIPVQPTVGQVPPSMQPKPLANVPIPVQPPIGQVLPSALLKPPVNAPVSAQPTPVEEATLVPALSIIRARPPVSTPEEQALQELDQAARGKDYRRIVNAWVPRLETYGPAQPYRTRYEYAKKQLSSALERFRDALKTDNNEEIVRSYDSILDGDAEVRPEELERLSRAVREFFSVCTLSPGLSGGNVPPYLPLAFMDAYYRQDNDESIVAVYGDIQRLNASGFFGFTSEETKRITLAQTRAPARQAFREALASGNVQQIVQVYDRQLHDNAGLAQEEIEQLELARRFVEAYDGGKGDADAIATAYDTITLSPYQQLFQLTQDEKDCVQRASKLSAARQRLRDALKDGRPPTIVKAYDSELELVHDRGISQEDREKVALARRFVDAYKRDQDGEIVHTYNEILASPHGKIFAFSHEEMARIQRAQHTPAPGTFNTYDPPMVWVNGVPIKKKQFQAVRAVRIQYVLFRYSQRRNGVDLSQETRRWLAEQQYGKQIQSGRLNKDIEQYLSNQALQDIAYDILIQNEFKATLSDTEAKDVQEKVELLFQEFIRMPGFDYDTFTRRHLLNEVHVKLVLEMYVRRDALARYRDDMRMKPLDDWLAEQKLDIKRA